MPDNHDYAQEYLTGCSLDNALVIFTENWNVYFCQTTSHVCQVFQKIPQRNGSTLVTT